MNLRCLWPPPHGTTDGRSRWPEDTSVIDSANDPTRNLGGWWSAGKLPSSSVSTVAKRGDIGTEVLAPMMLAATLTTIEDASARWEPSRKNSVPSGLRTNKPRHYGWAPRRGRRLAAGEWKLGPQTEPADTRRPPRLITIPSSPAPPYDPAPSEIVQTSPPRRRSYPRPRQPLCLPSTGGITIMVGWLEITMFSPRSCLLPEKRATHGSSVIGTPVRVCNREERSARRCRQVNRRMAKAC